MAALLLSHNLYVYGKNLVVGVELSLFVVFDPIWNDIVFRNLQACEVLDTPCKATSDSGQSCRETTSICRSVVYSCGRRPADPLCTCRPL